MISNEGCLLCSTWLLTGGIWEGLGTLRVAHGFPPQILVEAGEQRGRLWWPKREDPQEGWDRDAGSLWRNMFGVNSCSSLNAQYVHPFVGMHGGKTLKRMQKQSKAYTLKICYCSWNVVMAISTFGTQMNETWNSPYPEPFFKIHTWPSLQGVLRFDRWLTWTKKVPDAGCATARYDRNWS